MVAPSSSVKETLSQFDTLKSERWIYLSNWTQVTLICHFRVYDRCVCECVCVCVIVLSKVAFTCCMKPPSMDK